MTHGTNATGWTELTQGQYLDAAVAPHVNILGQTFYAFLLAQAMLAIYLKTEDIGTVIVTGVIISGTATAFLPSAALGLWALTLIVAATSILYKLIIR